ncbi:MAG: FKBP-type peptidyl-prolyl cis-trans isomerase N-terminal domain-containing protein [Verrucomicrobiota bacterium]
MKRSISLILACAASASIYAADSTINLQDQKERTSYALGVNFGNNLRTQGVEVNYDTLMKGMQDGVANKPKLTEAELRETFASLRNQITAHMQEKAKENEAEGEKFLAENAKKEGVKTLPSGLQYKILTEGSGASPRTNDEVSVMYTGKLLNGTVFDSTDKHGGQPTKFRVNRVIKGWTEALPMMKKGAQWELYIPAKLAYGERGAPAIPPNSTLIFDVKLVDIHDMPEQAQATIPNQQVTSPIIKVPSAEEMKKGAQVQVLKPEDVQKEIEKEKAKKNEEKK